MTTGLCSALSCGMSVSDSHEILTSRLTPWHCSWASPGIPQAHPARPPGRQQHWHWRRCAQRSGWARKKRSSRKKKKHKPKPSKQGIIFHKNKACKNACSADDTDEAEHFQSSTLCCPGIYVWSEGEITASHCTAPNQQPTLEKLAQGEKIEGNTKGWGTWHFPGKTMYINSN